MLQDLQASLPLIRGLFIPTRGRREAGELVMQLNRRGKWEALAAVTPDNRLGLATAGVAVALAVAEELNINPSAVL